MLVSQGFDLLASLTLKPVVSLTPVSLSVLPSKVEGDEHDEDGYRRNGGQIRQVAFAVIRGIDRKVCPHTFGIRVS